MQSSYENTLNLQPDFVVEYEIDLCNELKNAKLYQGMRTDFLYEGDDPKTNGVHMIWPELLDENGLVIQEKTLGSVSIRGQANMWIVSENMREYHLERLKVGTKGFWVSGLYKVANITVIKLGALGCI